jgi:hypothetical protein
VLDEAPRVERLERLRDSPERARSRFTVRAAISLARLLDVPRLRALRFTRRY